MTKAVATVAKNSVTTETVAVARLQDAVDHLYRSIERGRDGTEAMPVLPTAGLRRDLIERKRVLYASLRPISMAVAEADKARKSIAAFLGGYLNIKTDNPLAVASGYTAHLADQPLFAILEALDDFKNRRVVDRHDDNGKPVYFTVDHAPSAFRILDQVKKRAADVQAEHHKITKVLSITKITDGPKISPEEGEKVAEGLRLLVSGLTKRVTAQQEADRQEIRAQAQEARDRTARILADARRRNAGAYAESQDEQASG